ncbi:LysR family transcriptional regulator [Dyella sp. A6]|uniref:LysR family transcriptional regulator n=1 Tax=Dyella aluminiiresistens TaxID=3069105 RepID=UPI002E75F727|nr:LysR family transcriptional regulator [Dyella sp. A6]
MSRELPSLNALRAFEATARLESVSRAAEELHVTHGAVSRQTRALESELGVTLFAREGRGIALTPAGRQLRDGVAGAFDLLRQSCERLRRESRQAPLVLGCSGSVLARWVIPRLERMGRELPELKLHLSAIEEQPADALPGLDAALLLAEAPWPAAWLVDVLAPERIGPVFSPRHPHHAALSQAHAAALYREPLLHTQSRPQAWPAWARAQRIARGKLRYGQSFEHLYYLLEAAVAGLGVAIAPQPLVADDLAAGRLLAPWGFRATQAHWVLCTPRSARDPRLQALADWLRRELATP